MEKVIIKQDDHGFEVRSLTHIARVAVYFRGVWVVYVILFASISFMSSFITAVYIIGILILWNLIEFSNRTKYQILKITKEYAQLRIEYLSGSKPISVQGERSDFIFSKKPLWYKFKTPVLYLSVVYKRESILKQNSFRDLDEKVFDWLIDHFSGVPGEHLGSTGAPKS